MINFLKNTFSETKKQLKMITFLYVINLFVALIFGIIAYFQLKSSFGNSLSFDALISAFDATILFDFLRFGGSELLNLLVYSALLTIVYLLINIYFLGGIFYQFQQSDIFNINEFIIKSSNHFWRFFVLFIISATFLLLFFIIGIILYFLFSLIADGSTERGYFLWMLIPTTLLGIFITIILSASDIAKILIFSNPNLTVFDGFRKGIQILFKNPIIYKTYWLMVLLSIILYYIYHYVSLIVPMNSLITIIISFILFQIFIFIKVFIKIWFLKNAEKFSHDFIEKLIIEGETDKLSE